MPAACRQLVEVDFRKVLVAVVGTIESFDPVGCRLEQILVDFAADRNVAAVD